MTWTVTELTDRHGPYTRYEPGPASPTRASADEISGKSKSQAVSTLEQMFADVTAYDSGVIICRREDQNG